MPLQHLAGLAIAVAICTYAVVGFVTIICTSRAAAIGDKTAELARKDHELTLADAEKIHDYVEPVDLGDELSSLIRAGVAFMNEEHARRAAVERDVWERGLQ